MSEAKYKVGDDVRVPAVSDPLTIVAVETCYRFSPNGALWREDELTPYVPPLAVGDRVRHINLSDRPLGEIAAIKNDVAAIWCDWETDGDFDWFGFPLRTLQRIPTEAGK